MIVLQDKARIAWADVCKGLLITLLMFSHFSWVSKSGYNIDNSVINILGRYTCVWNCFFMSCFYIISGMFTNFNKSPKNFIWGKFKSLIIPAIVYLALCSLLSLDYVDFFKYTFLYGGGLWFLSSLFLSLLFLYLCLKVFNKCFVIFILLLLSFTGKLLDDANIFPNYWYHRNFMYFVLFLGLGHYYKDFFMKKFVGLFSVVAFSLTVVILFVMGIRVPSVVSIYNESLSQHPLTIWLSLTGSITCIHVCKFINHNVVLEYLGKISLIVYIYHMMFLSRSISVMICSLNGGNFIDSMIQFYAIIVSTLLFCIVISIIMDYRYLRWMKGKF